MCFELSKLHDIKFLSKHFAENGKEELFPNDSPFLSNLKNVKRDATIKI